MKILGSDIDGTLTVGGIEETKCAAIRAWRQAGNRFGPVSGRGPAYRTVLQKEYPLLEMDFFAAYNGAYIVDAEGKILHATECRRIPAVELTAALLDWGCPFVFVNGEGNYTVRKDGDPLREGEIYLSQLPAEPSWFHQISVQLESPAEVAVVTEKLRWKYGDVVNPLPNNICIDIVDLSVNKAEGLRRVAELYGGRESDIIAVGDNLNDMDMLKAFRSYAMENGVPEVKAVAKATVKTVTELIYRELS